MNTGGLNVLWIPRALALFGLMTVAAAIPPLAEAQSGDIPTSVEKWFHDNLPGAGCGGRFCSARTPDFRYEIEAFSASKDEIDKRNQQPRLRQTSINGRPAWEYIALGWSPGPLVSLTWVHDDWMLTCKMIHRHSVGADKEAHAKAALKKLQPLMGRLDRSLPDKSKLPVVFLPGVAGSVLCQETAAGCQNLWPLAPIGSRENLRLEMSVPYVIKASDIVRTAGLAHKTMDVYDSFVSAMERMGYPEGKWLFPCPYDWRKDVASHVQSVAKAVKRALETQPNADKVVLVAHSMGGLVARAYLAATPNAPVETLITIGTPHRGAPKAYYAIIMGYDFGNASVHHKLMKSLAHSFPGAYQLLPWDVFVNEQYRRAKWTLERTYGVWYRATRLKAGLNTPGLGAYEESIDWPWLMSSGCLQTAYQLQNAIGKDAPTGLRTYAIIGHGTSTLHHYDARTDINGMVRVDVGDEYRLIPDFGDGDGTVPLASARGLEGDVEFFVLVTPNDDANHGALPANKRVQALIRYLLEKTVSRPEQVKAFDATLHSPSKLAMDSLDLQIRCPADLHLSTADGGHLGLNDAGAVESSIPGGTMIIMGDRQYASILGSGGPYRVRVEGRATGTFDLDVRLRANGREATHTWTDIAIDDTAVAEFDLNTPSQAMAQPAQLRVTVGGHTRRIPPRVDSGQGSPRSPKDSRGPSTTPPPSEPLSAPVPTPPSSAPPSAPSATTPYEVVVFDDSAEDLELTQRHSFSDVDCLWAVALYDDDLAEGELTVTWYRDGSKMRQESLSSDGAGDDIFELCTDDASRLPQGSYRADLEVKGAPAATTNFTVR